MSDHIDTRDGWRETDYIDYGTHSNRIQATIGGDLRYWVREVPVPPLPTEPCTVIEVEGATCIRGDRGWQKIDWVGYRTDAEMQRGITGFKVLAEPVRWGEQRMKDEAEKVRRETAKVVLDRVRDEMRTTVYATPDYDALYREFGVKG